MAKPAGGTVPLEKLQPYEKLVATNPNIKRKGATVPHTSLNGHMFQLHEQTGHAGVASADRGAKCS